jgi:hypothetical protein
LEQVIDITADAVEHRRIVVTGIDVDAQIEEHASRLRRAHLPFITSTHRRAALAAPGVIHNGLHQALLGLEQSVTIAFLLLHGKPPCVII